MACSRLADNCSWHSGYFLRTRSRTLSATTTSKGTSVCTDESLRPSFTYMPCTALEGRQKPIDICIARNLPWAPGHGEWHAPKVQLACSAPRQAQPSREASYPPL